MSQVILNISKEASKDIRQFYDKYAGMLLGFIQGTIQDPKESEMHLIKIITSFILETNLNAQTNLSTWMLLRQHAQRILAQQNLSDKPLTDAVLNKVSNHPAENSDLLTSREKEIFTAVYYQGKSISGLAESLGEEENNIRIQLKSSIDKMRRLREN
ncbi:sigma-70 family RNA polymerase sigma factor [Agrobacterium tumefaciens]|nr:sigma-70 family RNA polymerase sigma factor [Agrobacterium tumefaciens]NTE17011.1 sigma-70 family RNA polymerase sigma factor [Agrobacterium tumefaciens]